MHSTRVHGKRCSIRAFVPTPECPVCRTFYHTRLRAIYHVKHTAACRQLIEAGAFPELGAEDLAALDAADLAHRRECKRLGTHARGGPPCRRAAAPLPAPAPTSEQRSGSWPPLPPLVAQTEHCTRPGRPALCCVETAGGCGVEMRCVASFSNTPARQGGHQVFNCDNVSVGAWIMTGSVPHPRRYGGCFLFSKLRPPLLQLFAFTASSHGGRTQ